MRADGGGGFGSVGNAVDGAAQHITPLDGDDGGGRCCVWHHDGDIVSGSGAHDQVVVGNRGVF